MSAVFNQGPRTLPVHGAAAVREYLLVDYRADGTVRPFVQASGEILKGSTIASSENGVAAVQLCNAEGTRYLKLDNAETITVAGFFTHGDTPGTIKPVGAGDPIIGYSMDAATSGADTFAIVECVLLPWAGIADAVVNGPLVNFPVGPVVVVS